MNGKVKEQIDKLLAELDEAGTFIQSVSIDEALRNYLASQKGGAWQECALMSHYLYGITFYTATLTEMVDGIGVTTTYVIDRDASGCFYLGTTAPVSGYVE